MGEITRSKVAGGGGPLLLSTSEPRAGDAREFEEMQHAGGTEGSGGVENERRRQQAADLNDPKKFLGFWL